MKIARSITVDTTGCPAVNGPLHSADRGVKMWADMHADRANQPQQLGGIYWGKKAEHILCSLEPAWVWNPCMLNVFVFSMRLTVKAIPTVCVCMCVW